MSIFNQYIQIEVNPDCLRFKDAIKKKDHIENECWMNTLLDHYADSLMRHKRGKLAKNLTREAIIKLIRKGDEEFKTRGASISNMHKVFKEFNIKARLYDIDGKQIYRHDPEDFNSCRIATFNALVKNSQVCTLNHSLESLKAKTKDENPNNLKICNNYFINNKKEAMKYRMIESIDDLLKMNEEDEYNMILKDNDLDKFMFDLTQAGYEPLIRYGAGKVVNVKMNLTFKIGKKQKKDDYTIVSQDLNTNKIDEDIAVNTEEKYNRVSDEMFKFHKKLISENHKSDYNETDVKILDESRTIVANGQFKLMTIKNGYLHHDRIRDSETCSIDKRKHSLFQPVRFQTFLSSGSLIFGSPMI